MTDRNRDFDLNAFHFDLSDDMPTTVDTYTQPPNFPSLRVVRRDYKPMLFNINACPDLLSLARRLAEGVVGGGIEMYTDSGELNNDAVRFKELFPYGVVNTLKKVIIDSIVFGDGYIKAVNIQGNRALIHVRTINAFKTEENKYLLEEYTRQNNKSLHIVTSMKNVANIRPFYDVFGNVYCNPVWKSADISIKVIIEILHTCYHYFQNRGLPQKMLMFSGTNFQKDETGQDELSIIERRIQELLPGHTGLASVINRIALLQLPSQPNSTPKVHNEDLTIKFEESYLSLLSTMRSMIPQSLGIPLRLSGINNAEKNAGLSPDSGEQERIYRSLTIAPIRESILESLEPLMPNVDIENIEFKDKLFDDSTDKKSGKSESPGVIDKDKSQQSDNKELEDAEQDEIQASRTKEYLDLAERVFSINE